MGNITLTDSYCSFVFLVSDRSFQGNHQICLGGGLRIGVLYGWTQWTWMAQSPAVMLRKGVNPHVSQRFLISFVCFFLKWKKQRTSAWLHPWECFNFIYFKHAFLPFIRKKPAFSQGEEFSTSTFPSNFTAVTLRNEAWKKSRKSWALARCDPAGYSNAWDDRPWWPWWPSEKRWIPKACEKIVFWNVDHFSEFEMNDVCRKIWHLCH